MFPDKARLRRLLPRLQTKSKLSLPSASSRREPWSRFAPGLLFARFAWFERSFDTPRDVGARQTFPLCRFVKRLHKLQVRPKGDHDGYFVRGSGLLHKVTFRN
jgi:hypothetical protein